MIGWEQDDTGNCTSSSNAVCKREKHCNNLPLSKTGLNANKML